MLHVPCSSYYYKPHEVIHKRYMDATAKDEIMQILILHFLSEIGE